MRQFEDLRITPQSVEAEQSVLGGLLLSGLANDGSAFERVADILREEDFYRADHRLIYRAMVDLAGDNKPLDLMTVSEWLKGRNELENAGGFAYLATMAKDTPSAANIRAYAEIVFVRSQERQLIAVGEEIRDLGFKADGSKPGEKLAIAERKLFVLNDRASRGRTQVITAREMGKNVLNYIEEASKRQPGELTGASTGLDDLDEMTDGMQRGDLIVVAGRPSMGKTTLACGFDRAVVDKGGAALEFTMEMDNVRIGIKHLAAWGSVDAKALKRGMLDEDGWARFAGPVKQLSGKDLYLVQDRGITVSEIVAVSRRLHRQLQSEGKEGVRQILVDQLNLIGSEAGAADSRSAEFGDIARRLKILAGDLNCSVVLVSQLNRQCESRPNKRPMMSDLRDSGEIEQVADTIMFVYRDEVYYPESPDKGTAEIIIAKQREGEIGTVRVTAQLQYARFVSFTPDVYGAGYR